MIDPKLVQQQHNEFEARMQAELREQEEFPPGGWDDETYEEDE